MLTRINSAVLHGLEARVISIETDLHRGMPSFQIVGQAESSVNEARERIRAAIQNCNLEYPLGRITVNMAPAGIRKRGSGLDLPMAIGILASSGQIFDDELSHWGLIGELSLDGELQPVSGILSMVMCLVQENITHIIVPASNVKEASLLYNASIYGVESLQQVVDHFNRRTALSQSVEHISLASQNHQGPSLLDYADVRGQEEAKRVLTIAAAGGHGLLMCGSPATGKTMLAERLPTILPSPSYEELLDITRIYSIAGTLDTKDDVMLQRPFRRPHHKVTLAGLIGGGRYPKPGEVTLAHNGVLFLDEFAEFNRGVIDALRQPLEEKKIVLTRLSETYRYPANFLLVAATNLCPCGYYGDDKHECTCSAGEIERYQRKISGPILNRIDLCLTLQTTGYNELNFGSQTTSAAMRSKVERARAIQEERFRGCEISLNSQIPFRDIDAYAVMEDSGAKLLQHAYESFGLNPRTLLKIKRIARTIADLDEHSIIQDSDVAEAISYQKGTYGA